jgi:hypothetical protein
MSTPSIPDAKVWESISQILQKTKDDPLSSTYAEIVSVANREAAADIHRILLAKGYTSAQVAQFDDLGRFQLRMALYWSLVNAGLLDRAKPYDCRAELEALPALMINGVAVAAGPSSIAGTSYGRLKAYDAVPPNIF